MEAMERAQRGLQLAYVLWEQGHREEAMQACEVAIEAAPGHPVPPAIQASLLMSAGEFEEAWKRLGAARRSVEPSAYLEAHFAEACFFLGRERQGERALSKAARAPDAGAHAALLEGLRAFWLPDST